MKLDPLISSLALLTVVNGAPNANRFKTPGGIDQVTIFPIVKEPTTPPIPECAYNGLTGADALSGAFRPLSGLRKLQSEMRYMYAHQQSILPQERKYRESRSAMSTKTADAEKFGECEVRKMAGDLHLNFADALCDCSSSKSPLKECEVASHFINSTLCASQYEFDTHTCGPMANELRTFDEIAPSCLVNIAGDASSLDLLLNNLLFPSPRILPDVVDISHTPSMRHEGRTLYLIWKAVDRFARLAEVSRYCDFKEDFQPLPQWESLLLIHSSQEGEERSSPNYLLAKRGLENFLILVRDVQTTFEGRLTGQLQQGFKYLDGYSGPLMDGVTSNIAAVTGPLDLYFDSFFQKNYNKTDLTYSTTLTHPRILVAGMGRYGGANAAALAEYLATKWDNPNMPWASILEVQSVTFGGPRVGSAEFSKSYREKVNGRNVISTYDGAVPFPCVSQAVCSKGASVVVTGVTGNYETYSPLGGLVLVDPPVTEKMVKKDERWGGDLARFDFVGQHYCAPKCWLTSEFCPDDIMDLCTPMSCQGLFDA